MVSNDPAVRLAAVKAFEDEPGWAFSLHRETPDGTAVVVRGIDLGDASTDDICFDPDHPVDCVDAVRAALAQRCSGKVVAVVGASGGAGCSTIALHLAERLGRMNKVCLAEAGPEPFFRARFDIGDGSKTWGDAGETDEDLMLASLPVRGGFRSLLAPEGGDRVPDEVVRRAARLFDVVVVDVGRGAMSFGPRAALLVVPPTRPGCAAAERRLRRTDVRWGVVINRTGSGGSITRRGVEALLERRVMAELPCTPLLRDVEDGFGLLTGPWTRWVRRMTRVAQGIERA